MTINGIQRIRIGENTTVATFSMGAGMHETQKRDVVAKSVILVFLRYQTMT